MIRITSKQNGFIRCGVVHPWGTMNYPDGTFSENELEVLKREPKLKVEIIEDDPPDNGGSEKKSKKSKSTAHGAHPLNS